MQRKHARKPEVQVIYDDRHERLLHKLKADVDAHGREHAISRWSWISTNTELTRALALIQLTPHVTLTTSTLPHLLGVFYWLPLGIESELAREPRYAAPLLESVIPMLYYFGAEHYYGLLYRENSLRVCIYSQLHPDDASSRYERFESEWLTTEHRHWPGDIAWDLIVVRDAGLFEVVRD